MADKKISELAVATTPLSGNELIPVVQSGVNKRITASDLMVAGPQGPAGPAGPMGPQGPAATLVPATTTTLGGIKVGSNLTITDDGTLSATGGGGGGGTTPDITVTASVDATSGTPNVTVTKTGTLDNPSFDLAFTGIVGAQGPQGPQGPQGDPAVLPAATADTLGGIKVGSGLAVTPDGTLSATGGGGGTAGVSSFNGRTGAVASQSGDYTAEMVGLGNVDNTSDANKPISTATQAALDEKANTADLATVATTGSYNDLSDKPTIPSAYTLPAATASTLGGVKVGSGLSVAADGTLSATGTGGASSLDDLSDVGLSTSPPAGALLGFDGTEWKDVELTGGGATSVTQTANGLQVYSSPYNLPNASATELGGVKVGAGLQIDGSGVLSATGGGGSGGLTEFEALTGVKNMLQIGGGYRDIVTNNDGSITVPAGGSSGGTYILTEDFRPSKYGLKSGDKLVVTGLVGYTSLKISSYSAQNITSTVSGDPGVWTISDAIITDDRAVVKLETSGLFAGGNLKIMARLDGVANSEFQPFALGNAGLTTSVACIADTLGCKNLIPPYSQPSGNTFTVNADTGGITVARTGAVGDRFVLAQGLIDSGVVKAGQRYLLSGIGTTNGNPSANASLTFEYELGGATQTITAAHYTDTLVDIPAGATGGAVVLTKLSGTGSYPVNPVYPMLRDARMADSTYQKPTAFPYSSLASLSDTNIPANPAAGSLLTLQNGKWTPNTLSTIAGGGLALIGGGLQSASVGVNGAEGLQLNGAKLDGTQYAASFINGQEISLYKAEPGQSFQKTLTIMPALTTPLTGLDTSQGGAVTASDTVLSAIGKIASSQIYRSYVTHKNGGNASSGVVKFIQMNRLVLFYYNGMFQGCAAENTWEKLAPLPDGFAADTASMFFTISGGMYLVKTFVSPNAEEGISEAGVYVRAARNATNKPDWSFGTAMLCDI